MSRRRAKTQPAAKSDAAQAAPETAAQAVPEVPAAKSDAAQAAPEATEKRAVQVPAAKSDAAQAAPEVPTPESEETQASPEETESEEAHFRTLAHFVRMPGGGLHRPFDEVMVGGTAGDIPPEFFEAIPQLDLDHPTNRRVAEERAAQEAQIRRKSSARAARVEEQTAANFGKGPRLGASLGDIGR